MIKVQYKNPKNPEGEGVWIYMNIIDVENGLNCPKCHCHGVGSGVKRDCEIHSVDTGGVMHGKTTTLAKRMKKVVAREFRFDQPLCFSCFEALIDNHEVMLNYGPSD